MEDILTEIEHINESNRYLAQHEYNTRKGKPKKFMVLDKVTDKHYICLETKDINDPEAILVNGFVCKKITKD